MDVVLGHNKAGDGGEEGEEEEEDWEEGESGRGFWGGGKKKWTEISASSDGLREKFSREQATLLALAREAAEATPEANASDGSGSFEDPGGPRLVFPEATLAYVLDLTSRAAAAVREAEEASAEDVRTTFEPTFEPNAPDPRATSAPDPHATTPSLPRRGRSRGARVGVGASPRSLTEREVPPALMRTDRDVVQTLCAMGMPRLLLALTASLPPRGAGRNGSDGRGPAAPRRCARGARSSATAALRDFSHPPARARAAVARVPRRDARAARQRDVRSTFGLRPDVRARRRGDDPGGDQGRGRGRVPSASTRCGRRGTSARGATRRARRLRRCTPRRRRTAKRSPQKASGVLVARRRRGRHVERGECFARWRRGERKSGEHGVGGRGRG